ncbi:Gpi Mannosyltransferase 4 [Manis pentadactyla]|nr:Gpi Mannosyltransferase 4 [Manis pentadactyla]
MALGCGPHSGWDPGRQGGLAWGLETGPKAAGAASCPSARPSLLAAHSCFGPLRRFPSLGLPSLEQMQSGQDLWAVCKAHLGTETRNGGPWGLCPTGGHIS